MSETLIKPRDEQELAEAVAVARAGRTTLSLVGASTKLRVGRPVETTATLTTRNIAGIAFYEPSELAIGVGPGTPLSLVQDLLAQHGQMLPFEPQIRSRLFDGEGEATVGGIAATNSSGPRRIAAGACRDSLLGVRFVNGRGEIVKSGGRVMKNVTGLDLVKLICGAWGTLGVMSEVVFKVLPKPERSASLSLRGLDDETAIEALSSALGSPFEVTGAAHVPAGTSSESLTVVRVEGFETSVAYRLGALAELWRGYGDPEPLQDEVSRQVWIDVGECRALKTTESSSVWKVSIAPSKAAGFARRLSESVDSRHFFDWGGNLIWFSVEGAHDGGCTQIRSLAQKSGGHAMLFKGPPVVRKLVDAFETLSPVMRKLTMGIKVAFDPTRILNPGRMYEGI